MDVGLAVARALLFLVLLASGCAKLPRKAATRQATRDLGVPEPLVPVVASTLPWVEIGLAFLIIVPTTAAAATVCCLVLLTIFTALIAVNIARGRHVDCHCFGSLGAGAIGWKSLARNCALIGVAVVAVAASGQAGYLARWTWLASASGLERLQLLLDLVLVACLGAIGVVILQLLRQNGRLMLRLEATTESHAPAGGPAPAPTPPIGGTAPRIDATGLNGERIVLDRAESPGSPVLLTFVDPACGPCRHLLPELGRWQREIGDRLTIITVTRGDATDNAALSDEVRSQSIAVQRDWEIATEYGVFATPSAVLIDGDGTVASKPATGVDAIRQLVSTQHGNASSDQPTMAPAATPDRILLPVEAL